MIPAAIKSNPSSFLIPAVLTATAIAVAVYVERSRRQRIRGSGRSDGGDDAEKKEATGAAAAAPPAPDVVDPPAETAVEEEEPAAGTADGEKRRRRRKVLVLISSFANANVKSNQDRALTILKGLKLKDDRMEVIDGAAPANRERRNELFGLSGIRAKYPQFFVVEDDGGDDDDDAAATNATTTTFVADYDGFEAMNEMGTLKETLNVA